MIEHHIQKEILHKLVICESARFAELRPKNIDGNLFTYHLQQLIKHKYVVKNDDGSYCLTPAGKAAGVNISLPAKEVLEQAHAILLLAVRDEKGSWLLRRRLAHPTYGKIGFIHGEPVANELVTATANTILLRRTGLSGTFSPTGSGYIRIFKDQALESFVTFTLLSARVAHDEPIPNDETGENNWYAQADFAADDMLQSMPDLVKLAESGEPHFFADLRYEMSSTH